MDPPLSATTKLSLLCSYGGQILLRPRINTLHYCGGDTRLTTFPSAAQLTLTSLITHLSTALNISNPFAVKYQLPYHDLDSLISLTTDDDVIIMLDEYTRISPTPTRIRLFLFFPKFNKEISWLADSEAETLVLDTTSSFGSSNSSVSSSNLPVKGHVEDFRGASLSHSSDNAVVTGVTHTQARDGQNLVDVANVTENKVSTDPTQSKISDALTGTGMQRAVQVPGVLVSLHHDQPHLFQYANVATQSVPQIATGMLPISPYYIVNSPVPQQQLFYQHNHLQPVYLVPVAQPYSLPTQIGLDNTYSYSHPPTSPNVTVSPDTVGYQMSPISSLPEPSVQVMRTVAMATQLIDVPQNDNAEVEGQHQLNNHASSVGVDSVETFNYGDDLLDEDSVRSQIYKTQPPPPSLPAQYQTISHASAVFLAGSFAQLHTESSK